MSHEIALGERIYTELKRLIMAGSLDQHSRLDFADLAATSGVSTTPVREAIMRLLGEGLVELHPKGGARPALLNEYRLRMLLDAQMRIVSSVLSGASGAIVSGGQWPQMTTIEQRTRHIFNAVARSADNPELEDMISRINDRLSPYRHHEHRVLTNVMEELEALHATLIDVASFRRALRAHHRRRIAIVGALIWKVASAR